MSPAKKKTAPKIKRTRKVAELRGGARVWRLATVSTVTLTEDVVLIGYEDGSEGRYDYSAGVAIETLDVPTPPDRLAMDKQRVPVTSLEAGARVWQISGVHSIEKVGGRLRVTHGDQLVDEHDVTDELPVPDESELTA